MFRATDGRENTVPARILDLTVQYRGWTRVSLAHLELGNGERIAREIEDHGPAVAVLPYDTQRRTVMLVRLLRAPVLAVAGEADLLEACAGLRDEDEAADAARREAHEELGVRLSALEHVGRVWTMPGLSTEQMDLYLAPYAQQDRIGPGGGLAAEHENITVVEMPLDALWNMVEAGRVTDMKTLTLALLLRQRHPDIFT